MVQVDGDEGCEWVLIGNEIGIGQFICGFFGFIVNDADIHADFRYSGICQRRDDKLVETKTGVDSKEAFKFTENCTVNQL